ncbi:hypothetical protein V8C86DRAFT_2891115 [Haematococcus lacustris]
MMTSRQLLVLVLKNAVQDGLPLPSLRAMFEEVCLAFAEVQAAAAQGGAQPSAQAAVLSPELVTHQVFMELLEPMGHDHTYLLAAVTEYSAALTLVQLTVPHDLLDLSFRLLLSLGLVQPAAVQLYRSWPSVSSATATMLASQLLHPVPGAAQAVRAAKVRTVTAGDVSHGDGTAIDTPSSGADANGYGFAAKAGKDAQEAELVRSLLQSGQVLRAARLVRDFRITSVHPREILAAALRHGSARSRRAGAGATVDAAGAAAVYRCFRESLMPLYPTFESACAALHPPA